MNYLILNPRDLENQINEIRQHIERQGPVLFIEVTNTKVTSEFQIYRPTFYIDPQHTITGQGGEQEQLKHSSDFTTPISAIKYCQMFSNKINMFLTEYLSEKKYRNAEVLVIVEKADMDTIASIVFIEKLITNYTPSLNYNRLNDIHEVDCHLVTSEWNPDQIPEFSINWINILGTAMGDFKSPIENRISIMKEFLLTGKLPVSYQTEVEREYLLLQQATVEKMSGIIVITSQSRGASMLLYKKSPYGILYSPDFQGRGPKFSVIEYKGGKYLKLEEFFQYMNTNFPEVSGKWGGNIKSGAGGSPIPCNLKPAIVAEVLSKFLR